MKAVAGYYVPWANSTVCGVPKRAWQTRKKCYTTPDNVILISGVTGGRPWHHPSANTGYWLRDVADARGNGTTGEPPVKRFRRDAPTPCVHRTGGRPSGKSVIWRAKCMPSSAVGSRHTQAITMPVTGWRNFPSKDFSRKYSQNSFDERNTLRQTACITALHYFRFPK